MPIAPRSDARVAILVGTAVLGVLLLVAVLQVAELDDERAPCCDWAVLELGTRAFTDGDQLLGLYSRTGWHHPGPAPFLLMAPAVALLGRTFAAYQVTAVVVHLVALAALLVLCQRREGTRGIIVAGLAVGAWYHRFGLERLRDPWNPYLASSLTVLTVVIAAGALTGRRWWWPMAAVAAASLAAQSHLGALPAVGVAIAAVGVDRVRRWRRHDEPATRRYELAGALAAAAVLWALPAIDQVVGSHNLTDIVRRGSGGPEGAVPPADVATGLLHVVTVGPQPQGRALGPASPFVDFPNPGVGAIVVALLGVAGGVWCVLRRRRSPFPAALAGLALGGLAASAVALTAAQGPFLPYLLLPFAGLGLVLWLAIALGVVAWVADLLGDRSQLRRGVAALALVLVVVAQVTLAPAVRRSGEPFLDTAGSPDIDRLADAVRVSDPAGDPVEVALGEDVPWFDAVALLAAINRFAPVRGPSALEPILGPRYASSDETPDFVLRRTSTPVRPGFVPLAVANIYAIDHRVPTPG